GAGRQLSDGEEIVSVAILFGFERARHPDLSLLVTGQRRRVVKLARHDPDHFVVLPIEHYGLPNRVRLACEPLLPEAVAEHRNASLGAIFFIRYGSAEDWGHTKHRKQIRCNGLAFKPHGVTAAGKVKVRSFGGSQLRKRPDTLAVVFDLVWREFYLIYCFQLAPNCDKPVSVVVRQRLEQNRVDDAEDRSVCADAQCERHDSDQREPGFLQQQSSAVAQILY